MMIYNINLYIYLLFSKRYLSKFQKSNSATENMGRIGRQPQAGCNCYGPILKKKLKNTTFFTFAL